MGLAEIVVLILVAAGCYALLAPVRKRVERWWMRRGGRSRRASVIPLVRGGDGVYAARSGKDTIHGDKR